MDNEKSSSWINFKWISSGILVCFALSILSYISGIGIIGGFLGFGLMGMIIGYASPGNAVKEAGIAAFIVASIGFIINNLLLSLFGVGVVIAMFYGIAALFLAVIGGYIGEKI